MKRSNFHRSYNLQNTYERFRIYKIDKSFKNPRYFLKEEDGSYITGSFTRNELTRVNLEKFKASVIAEKNIKGKKYVLLDFKGYSPKYQEWKIVS